MCVIHRIDLIPSDKTLGFRMRRWQYPVRLACCFTVHKSQGATLDRVGIILDTFFWTHGMLYVALTRARKRKDIIIVHNHTDTRFREEGEFYTKNIVYNEVLI